LRVCNRRMTAFCQPLRKAPGAAIGTKAVQVASGVAVLPVRMLIAVAIEGSWEIAENSSFVINRYREATISLDYFGDSIINSMSDICCCGLGFLIAYKIRFWWSLALFVFVETVLIVTIHDSLIINVIMLLFPNDAIKNWQMGG